MKPIARVGHEELHVQTAALGRTVASGESAAIDWPRLTAMLVTTPAMGGGSPSRAFASTVAMPCLQLADLARPPARPACARARAIAGLLHLRRAQVALHLPSAGRRSACSLISWSVTFILLLLGRRRRRRTCSPAAAL
jgi:hypothetical protein